MDQELLQAVELATTGADIHAVRNIVMQYIGLGMIEQVSGLSVEARARYWRMERLLRAYIAWRRLGIPVTIASVRTFLDREVPE